MRSGLEVKKTSNLQMIEKLNKIGDGYDWLYIWDTVQFASY